MADVPIFILSYNRPNKIRTIATLEKIGCKQKIYVVVGDDDPQLPAYCEIYKNTLIIFSKEQMLATTDTGTNQLNMRSPIYARNFILSITKKDKIDYFCMLDDDLESFGYRFFDSSGKLKSTRLDNIELVLSLCVEYMDKTGLPVLGFGHRGSYIGGSFRGGIRPNLNQFLVISGSADIGNFRCLNCEDTIMMLDLALRGKLPLEVRDISFSSPPRTIGTSSGTAYSGWYETNFLAVIYCPSAIKVSHNKSNLVRKNRYLLPKIISGRHKNEG